MPNPISTNNELWVAFIIAIWNVSFNLLNEKKLSFAVVSGNFDASSNILISSESSAVLIAILAAAISTINLIWKDSLILLLVTGFTKYPFLGKDLRYPSISNAPRASLTGVLLTLYFSANSDNVRKSPSLIWELKISCFNFLYISFEYAPSNPFNIITPFHWNPTDISIKIKKDNGILL